jgi:hypothetical protein
MVLTGGNILGSYPCDPTNKKRRWNSIAAFFIDAKQA